jgi:hypothetical protein
MTIALDQTGSGTGSSVTSVTATFGSTPAAGSIGIAVLSHAGNPGTYTAPTGWVNAGSGLNSSIGVGTCYGSIWYTLDAHTNTNPTWTWTNAVNTATVGVSYTGCNTSSPLDQSVFGAINQSGSTLTTGSVTTTQAAEVCVGLFASQDVSIGTESYSGPTNGFTIESQINVGTLSTSAGISDLVVSSIQTGLSTAVTAAVGAQWMAWMVTLKAAPVPVAGYCIDVPSPATAPQQDRVIMCPN